MFYQDNNDYMRDSYFYGNSMNSNFPYGNGMMNGNMQNSYMPNNFQMPMQNHGVKLENMYPQIYKIINPVANRVISNSNYQYMTEDVLNNMVDTVYNIVEGDVSNLVSMQDSSMQADDTVSQNQATSSASNINNNRTQNTSNNSSNDRRGNNSTMDNQTNSNRLLKDLIKIILIKELISRRNSNSFMSQQNGMQMNYNPGNYYGVL